MKFKILLTVLAATLSITSCKDINEDPPLKDDDLGPAVEFTKMQQEFIDASGAKTPEDMKVGEWAYFIHYARLYTGNYQSQGYTTAQVVDTKPIENEVIDGVNVPIKKINTLITNYLPVSNPGEAPQPDPQNPQKEWACKYAAPPYYQWYGECSLPPEQNLWVFHYLGIPKEPIFYSFSKKQVKQKLPPNMVEDGRCYDFENCEIDVNILEYELYFKNADGKVDRRRYKTSFAPQLPYLASNIKTCFSTKIVIEDEEHPVELCQELVDFKFGNTTN